MNQAQAYSKIEDHFRINKDRFTKRFSRYFSNKERGEDVVSMCYVNALTYWKSAPEEDIAFEKWMRTILNNAGKKNHREEFNHGATNNEESYEEEGTPSIVIPRIIINEVTTLIESKSQPTQTILKLAMLDGWKPTQIAEVVDTRLASIKRTIYDFRKEVREKFKWSV